MSKSFFEQLNEDDVDFTSNPGGSAGPSAEPSFTDTPDFTSERGPSEMPGSSPDAGKSMTLTGVGSGPEGLPDADDFEFLDKSKGSKLLSRGTLLAVLVVAVAAIAIYAMRATQGSGVGADAEIDSKIELALAKFSAGDNTPGTTASEREIARLRSDSLRDLFRDTDHMVAMFTSDAADKQIPLESLAKNPFQASRPKVKVVEVEKVDEEALAREARRKLLEREFSELSLQTVMQGRVPVAIVNGQLLQVGQKIGEFKVSRIDGLTVTVSADGKDFNLSMQERKKVN